MFKSGFKVIIDMIWEHIQRNANSAKILPKIFSTVGHYTLYKGYPSKYSMETRLTDIKLMSLGILYIYMMFSMNLIKW